MKALMFVILFFLFLPTASATIVHFEPSSFNIEAGTQETVSILVEPTESIDTVATDYIFWDPSIVDCVGIQRGDLFNETTIWITGTIDNDKGTIRNMVWASETPTDNTGTFITLVFYGKKDGTTTLTINENECGIARSGQDISKSLFGHCIITVIGDVVIIPASFSPDFLIVIGVIIVAVILVIIVLLLRKRK